MYSYRCFPRDARARFPNEKLIKTKIRHEEIEKKQTDRHVQTLVALSIFIVKRFEETGVRALK